MKTRDIGIREEFSEEEWKNICCEVGGENVDFKKISIVEYEGDKLASVSYSDLTRCEVTLYKEDLGGLAWFCLCSELGIKEEDDVSEIVLDVRKIAKIGRRG